jgi:alkyl hydroperoxide reductase subunit D
MTAVDALRAALPETARDIKINLQTVLGAGTLSAAQRWGVALAAAIAARSPALRDAIAEAAGSEVDAAVMADAEAAAALMAMTNVYYRFRHLIGKPSYAAKPARLRMTRLAQPASNKVDFELFALAVSAVNGCEACLRAHEEVVTTGGASEDQVHDAIRIAATVYAAAVALEAARLGR